MRREAERDLQDDESASDEPETAPETDESPAPTEAPAEVESADHDPEVDVGRDSEVDAGSDPEVSAANDEPGAAGIEEATASESGDFDAEARAAQSAADDSATMDTRLDDSSAVHVALHSAPAHTPDPRRRSRLVLKNRELHVQKKRMRLALIAVSISSVLIVAGLLWKISHDDEQLNQIQGALLEARTQTRNVQSELDESREQIAALVEGRVPGLRRVEYDRVIEIAELGVRNMTFTRTTTSGGSRMEVRIVMENDTQRALDSHVTLVIVDRVGLEMGRARVGLADGEHVNGMRDMLPGEVRSFTSEVPIARGDRPAYFLLLRP